jgi:predicted phage tail protein
VEFRLDFAETALIRLRGTLEDLGKSTVPKTTYILEGMRVDLPTGYDPVAGTFASPWAGTFDELSSLCTAAEVAGATVINLTPGDAVSFLADKAVSILQTDGSIFAGQVQSVDAAAETIILFSGLSVGTAIGATVTQLTSTYSNDPAWCLWNLLTSERYGLGIDPGRLDKWSFALASRRNLELVPDLVTDGVTERRYTFNAALTRSDDGYKMATQIASSMDAQLWISTSGIIILGQDRPETDPARIITQANVVDGLFTYEGTAVEGRRTSAVVTYRNAAEAFESRTIREDRRFAVDRYGDTPSEADAPGVTSQGQAIRRARYVLITDELENQIVRFKMGLENALLQPGEVIGVADSFRSGSQIGGRIVSALGFSNLIYITAAGGTFADSVPVPGSLVRWTTAAGVAVSGNLAALYPAATTSLLQINQTVPATAWSDPVAEGGAIMISNSVTNPELWRVVEIADDGEQIYSVLAVRHDPDKWDAIEDPDDSGDAYPFPADPWPPA